MPCLSHLADVFPSMQQVFVNGFIAFTALFAQREWRPVIIAVVMMMMMMSTRKIEMIVIDLRAR